MTLPRPVFRRVTRTAAVMWLMGRAVLLLLGAGRLAPFVSAGFVWAVVGLTWLDIRSTDERLLYDNLAVRPAQVSLVAAAVAVALEAAGGLLLAALLPGGPRGLL